MIDVIGDIGVTSIYAHICPSMRMHACLSKFLRDSSKLVERDRLGVSGSQFSFEFDMISNSSDPSGKYT